MITRLLPPEEWPRLEALTVGNALIGKTAEQCKVVVVEDAGEIVGCWALVGMPHVEGIEILPSHRRGLVGKYLLAGMTALLDELAIPTVLTAALEDQPDVGHLLERIGAQRIPATFYAWTPQAVKKES